MRLPIFGLAVLCISFAAAEATAGVTLKEIRFPAGLGGKNGPKTPPALAPLSQRIVFRFSGKPKLTPGIAAGLRIEIDPANGSGQPVGQLAFGDFRVSGNDVVFTPRLPTGGLPLTFGTTSNLANDASLPGLLPATTYRIVVTQNSPNSVQNLTKIAPSLALPLTFTTVPVASGPDPFPSYFPNAVPGAPKLPKKQLFPAPGTKGVHPSPLQDPAGAFDAIPAKRRPPFRVRFDRAVNPAPSNLERLRLRAVLAADGTPIDETIEVERVVTENAPDRATVLLFPVGLLPLGTTLALEVSDLFASLSGAVKNDGLSPETYALVTQYQVAQDPAPGQPLAGAIVEDYDDGALQDVSVAAAGLQPASWDAADSNVLRASFGFGGDGSLGPFAPPSTGGPLTIVLDTDFQQFPLFSGATPGAKPGTTIQGGVFHFTDFTLPANVTLIGVGTKPLIITATGNVLIEGVIDIAGKDGTQDDSFNSAITPATGGSGGPGGGKGGDGHPTMLANGATSLLFMQTPPFGQTGFGPGNQTQLGGGGGQSGCTLPWPDFANGGNCTTFNESGDGSRGSGGGGGSFANFLPNPPENPATPVSGRAGGIGIGNHLPVPFTPSKPFPGNPPYNSAAHPAYSGTTNSVARRNPNPTFTQAVQAGLVWDQAPFFAVGGAPTSWSNTRIVTFGGSAGIPVFADGNPDNDFIGPNGELAELIGGQGGGGGGSRTEGLDLNCLPITFGAGFPLTVNDAKGAGGGGGGGALMIEALGTITLNGPVCRINAQGGRGRGGETIGNGAQGGNGGGGSGGAIILKTASNVIMTGLTNIDTNPNNPPGVFRAIDVSGGCGHQATALTAVTGSDASGLQVGDGGPGGPGIVQIHVPVGTTPVLQTDRIGARVIRSTFNVNCASITGTNANYGGTTQIDPLVPMVKTPSFVTSVSYARSTWYDLGAVTPPYRPLIQTGAGALAGPLFGVPGEGPFFKGTDPTTGLVQTNAQGKVLNAFTNDFEIDSPDLQQADFLPQGDDLQTVTIRFQGADEDPANLGLPNLATATAFVTDATQINGKRFVRYEIVFDIAAAPGAIPQQTTSRPQVNVFRLPFQY